MKNKDASHRARRRIARSQHPCRVGPGAVSSIFGVWGTWTARMTLSMALGISRDGKTAVGCTVVVDFYAGLAVRHRLGHRHR